MTAPHWRVNTLAPATPPAPAAELAETVDLSAQVPCDWAECTRAALWIIRPDCTHPVLACTRCRRRIDNWCSHPVRYVTCKRCGEPIPEPIDWRPL